MKKTINTALIALTVAIALHGTANAKILRQRTIPVTKSTKDLFIDTKNLKASTSPEELKQNIQKVATDSKKDPYIRLKNEEMVHLDEIKNKEAEISGLEGYSGMFFLDSDELMEARNERADLYKELYEVNIDFDGASEAWRANKKSTGGGCYKYICEAKTATNKCCLRQPMNGSIYCKMHCKNNK